MEHHTPGDDEKVAANHSIFDDVEPPRLDMRGERPTLLALPLEQAAMPVKRANGIFEPLHTPVPPVVTAAPPTSISAPRVPWRQLAVLYLVGLLIIAIDQASKLYIEGWLQVGERYEIIPGLAPYFQFTHTINRGAAFGMFQNGGVVFSVVAVIVAIIIVVYNHQLPAGQNWLRLALGLQLGGALGNFIDRVRQGYVTDFLDVDVSSLIDFRWANWPIFNVADMAIVGGVIVLVIVMIFMDEEALNPTPAKENEAVASAD